MMYLAWNTRTPYCGNISSDGCPSILWFWAGALLVGLSAWGKHDRKSKGRA